MEENLKITFLPNEEKIYVADGVFAALSDPEYVRFALHPGEKFMVLTGCSMEDRKNSEVPCDPASDWKPFLHTKKSALAHLYRALGWEEGMDMCVPGHIVKDRRRHSHVLFDAKEAARIPRPDLECDNQIRN